MKPQQQNFSADIRAVTQRNSRSKTSSEPIPIDLIVEIFSRLPAKSIARCRCVSKLWTSIPRLPYFTELFLTRSSARPQLLFACVKNNDLFFFSSSDERSCLLSSANYHMKKPLPFLNGLLYDYISISGLVCIGGLQILKGKPQHVWLICNPSTGQFLILPKVKFKSRMYMRSYFGYDPFEKQHKVLHMTWSVDKEVYAKHRIMTLGSGGESSWEKIKCSIPHARHVKYDQICINGVLYYSAFDIISNDSIIVCFDVRSEKFRVIKNTEEVSSHYSAILINYNGKLGSLGYNGILNGYCERFKLRVLEDSEKEEWSVKIYSLPFSWKNMVGTTWLRFVGVTRTNEIVFSSYNKHERYYVFYYNTERNTVTRVEIKGMEAFSQERVYTFLDHVEDVKLLY